MLVVLEGTETHEEIVHNSEAERGLTKGFDFDGENQPADAQHRH